MGGLSIRAIAASLLADAGATLPIPRNLAAWSTQAQVEAARRASAARDADMSGWAALLAEANRLQDWKTLGYLSWENYIQREALMRHFPPRRKPKGQVDTRSVYFIQAVSGGLVKIGVATNPEDRLAQIQHMSPVPLRIIATLPGAGQQGEAALHQRFAGARRHGEWFEPVAELVALIEGAAQ